jgi:hypothetical protein
MSDIGAVNHDIWRGVNQRANKCREVKVGMFVLMHVHVPSANCNINVGKRFILKREVQLLAKPGLGLRCYSRGYSQLVETRCCTLCCDAHLKVFQFKRTLLDGYSNGRS